MIDSSFYPVEILILLQKIFLFHLTLRSIAYSDELLAILGNPFDFEHLAALVLLAFKKISNYQEFQNVPRQGDRLKTSSRLPSFSIEAGYNNWSLTAITYDDTYSLYRLAF